MKEIGDNTLMAIIIVSMILSGTLISVFGTDHNPEVIEKDVVKTYQVINGDTTLISTVESKIK